MKKTRGKKSRETIPLSYQIIEWGFSKTRETKTWTNPSCGLLGDIGGVARGEEISQGDPVTNTL
jgi:hypothetical protein